MKKAIALILTLVMFASLLSVSAMAEETWYLNFDGAGIALYVPDSFMQPKGMLYPSIGEELGYNTGWYYLDMDYFAMSEDEYNAIIDKDDFTEEDHNMLFSNMANIFSMYTLADGANLDAMAAYLAQHGFPIDLSCVSKIDESAGYTYYLYMNPNQNISAFRPEFADEFRAMQAQVQEIVKSAELYMPVDPFAEMEGRKLSFSTTDINGNPVSSEELFGQHEITMLNVWASWCGPCVGELSELEAINGRLAGKNCAVVGLLYDGADPDAVQTARGILQEKGVTYTIILPPDNVDELFDMSAFPTTFFVDKTGTLVGKPVEGAAVDAYEGAVDGLLSAGSTAELKQGGFTAGLNEGKSAAPKGAAANDAGMYRVYVSDESGKPVEGATVQFCSDSECTLGKTDAQGVASFQVPEGNYTVHLLKVPADYEKNSAEFTMPNTYSDLSIVVDHK